MKIKSDKKSSNRGGARPGAGRKSKETKVIYRRVPAKHYAELLSKLDDLIKEKAPRN